MNYFKARKLMIKYAYCPKCGSENLGNGQGGITLENDTFRRWCKCGFDKTVNEDDKKMGVKQNVYR